MIDPDCYVGIQVLDAKTPDVSCILKDFNNCLSEYKDVGRRFPALAGHGVDQIQGR